MCVFVCMHFCVCVCVCVDRFVYQQLEWGCELKGSCVCVPAPEDKSEDSGPAALSLSIISTDGHSSWSAKKRSGNLCLNYLNEWSVLGSVLICRANHAAINIQRDRDKIRGRENAYCDYILSLSTGWSWG